MTTAGCVGGCAGLAGVFDRGDVFSHCVCGWERVCDGCGVEVLWFLCGAGELHRGIVVCVLRASPPHVS